MSRDDPRDKGVLVYSWCSSFNFIIHKKNSVNHKTIIEVYNSSSLSGRLLKLQDGSLSCPLLLQALGGC